MQTNRKAKFRLERIRVKEVSGVDRPANLEPFLVVKRDSMGEPTQTDQTEKATPPAPPPHPPAPAPTPSQPAPPAPPAPQQPGKLGPLSTATKDMVLDAAKSCIESLQGIAMAVGEAPTDDGAGVPPELAASFSAAIGKLQQLVQAVTPAPAPPPAPPEAPAAKSAGPSAAPEQNDAAPALDLGAMSEAIAGGVAKAVAAANAEMRASIDKLVTTFQVATAKGVVKHIPVGNGQRGEDGGEKKPSVIWPDDIAESAKKREDVR